VAVAVRLIAGHRAVGYTHYFASLCKLKQVNAGTVAELRNRCIATCILTYTVVYITIHWDGGGVPTVV